MPPASPVLSARFAVARRGVVAAVVLAVAAVTGCSTDGRVGPESSISAADCPFSGSASPREGGSGTDAAVVLEEVETAKDGCVDVVTLSLDVAIGEWSAAYADGPLLDGAGEEVPTTAEEHLVVTLDGASPAEEAEQATAVVVPVGPLDYVEEVLVVPDGPGELRVALGIEEKLPFEVNETGGEVLEVRTG